MYGVSVTVFLQDRQDRTRRDRGQNAQRGQTMMTRQGRSEVCREEVKGGGKERK